MITVPVVLGPGDAGGARGYDVLVGRGASAALPGVVAERVPSARQAAVVTDEQIAAAPWFARIDPGVAFDVHTVEPGERAKSMATVEALCRAFARTGLTRGDVVVAVGGGVVSDLAGFAAACYHRGTAYCTVATTLLGQVDAAIGGKTGVDLPEGKNLAGAFWQPAGVLCDTALLETMPAREWVSGKGEMAKYTFLGEPGLPELELDQQVACCVALKAAVVGDDEREGGRRVLLNYGHTLAHALEAAALEAASLEAAPSDAEGGLGGSAGIRHGEAVAVGLVYAALLARRLGRIGDDRVALHRAVVERFGLSSRLPAGLSDADRKELLGYMARDKKASHDLSFVLDGPQGVELVRGVGPDDALGALEELACT